ncbi:hypothetical protein [Salinimicrobium sediminilitoris]|uniref:hypothetical protein n=1 Tax=Salinimicrobium sediminilitoris TaxID=2876715 RepID=UPI001E512354|nr:hypothetical protein [Salinimicrobium sediminilitoris]MCC8358353.1 hypothetical protein [Salinimicrobium sediminilitoris]
MKSKIEPVSGFRFFTLLLVIGVSFSSCKNETEDQRQNEDELSGQMETGTEQVAVESYQAQITSVNGKANKNRSVSGIVRLEVQGDELKVFVEASGLEPGMMYLQHLHGAKDGGEINCPDSAADENNDGVVDITEAYDVAGVTMIMLHNDPTNFEVESETYPTADETGNISYQQVINLDELRQGFMEEFDWGEMDFGQFTYLIHGVEEEAVPESAESVKGLPAHVTLPIGCAKISQS